MRWPWQKKQPDTDSPVVKPIYQKPITEFEAKRLAQTGRWLTIQIQVMPKGAWCNWKHDVPPELKKEAKEALVALALELQKK